MSERDSANEQQWNLRQLHDKLAVFEEELRAAGLSANTVHMYIDRSERFLRWFAGDYQPQGPRG